MLCKNTKKESAIKLHKGYENGTSCMCLAVGYLFGIFQTGYIYGRVHGIDIRKYGSGNSSSTNALRVMGKKAGLTVFAGDF